MKRLYTDAEILEMRAMRREGFTVRAVAEHFGCSIAYVSMACRGRRRAAAARPLDSMKLAAGDPRPPEARGGWGLWHKNDRRWIKHPMSERRREYQTRGQAAAAMVQMTAGRRDALTNYFRISVAPRRLVSHNG